MDELSVLIEAAQANDEEAKKVLIERNMGLIRHILKRFTGRGYDMEDLFQIGCIGMLKAIERFDLSLGLCFSTYAVPMIAGEIRRFLRDDGMIKVSRSIKENAYKVSMARQELENGLHREPTIGELAQHTGLSTEEIVMTMEAGARVESIYSEDYYEEGENPGGAYYEDSEKNPVLDRILIHQLIESLEESDRRLIWLRYFQEKTQVETAGILGISQVQVSRLEKKILCRMRQMLV
ncbi:MAG: SigB/SigF/SigG family RNA polymerase sigma factor [Acetatifactor sp.]|nr:SigB/SigF/SigG family RNA polymerase sigma factor [Acetatifactor sp.]